MCSISNLPTWSSTSIGKNTFILSSTIWKLATFTRLAATDNGSTFRWKIQSSAESQLQSAFMQKCQLSHCRHGDDASAQTVSHEAYRLSRVATSQFVYGWN